MRTAGRAGAALTSRWDTLDSRCGGWRAQPATEIAHNMAPAASHFGADDFRRAARSRSLTEPEFAAPTIAITMIPNRRGPCRSADQNGIPRNAAIMDRKFESNSNNYDESNLNGVAKSP
jgi:hypothetical protein